MTSHELADMQITVHLTQQSTVTFRASELWPMEGGYGRFATDLASFATEVGRRLRTDGFLGFARSPQEITMIPLATVKRIDFNAT